MLKAVDALLDRMTMYRLLLYYLGGLLAAAVGLSAFGDLHYRPLYIVISTFILLAACWLANKVLACIFKAPANTESSIITALILALIITPQPTGFGIGFLLVVSGLAMASKYLLAIRKVHLFNPAAIAVALTALGPRQTASWWIGTAVMVPFVLIGGLLLARKIQKGTMILTFLAATALATVVYSLFSQASVTTSLHSMLLSSPVLFLGFVMLTEPLTSPTTAAKQNWYAVLVGVLLPPQVHLLNFYASPELALVAGNVFSYFASPQIKLFPVFKTKVKIAAHTVDFIFSPAAAFSYQPGQYMEWTLPHHTPDSRGNRRYFTLASSPTEPDVRIGVKFYENGSSFKRALLAIDQSTPIVAAQAAGDFVLPVDPAQKIVFIAGGIGITPFRSMIKYLLDKNEHRSITLLYSAQSEADIAYRNIFEEARHKIGLQAIYMMTGAKPVPDDSHIWPGRITPALITRHIPDYAERVFYISGTHTMVEAVREILDDLGVDRHQIKIDFFPGY